MCSQRPAVNIVNVTGRPLFTPHFDPERDDYDLVENGSLQRQWDLLVVFEGLPAPVSYQVRAGGALFISGEPPEVGGHHPDFLRQFDRVFCARASQRVAPYVSSEQHFNNWHFGFRGGNYRYSHAEIRDFPPPKKTAMLSAVTSSLNYLPMHIRRLALINHLQHHYSGLIDFFGRPHNFVEHKEDAILPYRFHLCIENCSVPGLWTEKIADALLAYAVPIYAGCPDIERYFPGAAISINVDDYSAARCTIDAILANGEAEYRRRFDAVAAARRNLIEKYDISALIREELRLQDQAPVRTLALVPEAALSFSRHRDLLLRTKRKMTALYWRTKVSFRG